MGIIRSARTIGGSSISRAGTPAAQNSVQPRPDVREGVGPASSNALSFIDVWTQADELPIYWSRNRDRFMRDFAYSAGNDILMGTLSTAISKVVTTGWFLEGPERTANLYKKILIQTSDFNAGLSQMLSRTLFDFFTQDPGGWIERVRANGSTEGAAIGFNHFDNQSMWNTGDPEFPAQYQSQQSSKEKEKQELQTLHRSQVIHLVDIPSPQETRPGIGFCALSRAWTTARILMDITRYERERLSDLPPAGLLMLNNIAQKQWEDLNVRYDTQHEQAGNHVWRRVMVVFGLDPSVPVSAEFFSFSQLPEHFDKRTWTELAVYAFALAFRMDPREIWPVSAGTLGTGTEASIQHIKAKAKGPGLLFSEIERAFNDGLSLPSSLTFGFDYIDTEEDKEAAEINSMKAEYIRKLWEPDAATGTGIIDTDEARSWLVRQGLFDEEELQTMDDTGRATDTELAKSRVDMGPRVRIHHNPATGRTRTVHLQRPMWRGWSPKAKARDPLTMAAQNYAAGAIDAGALTDMVIGLAVEKGADNEGIRIDH